MINELTNDSLVAYTYDLNGNRTMPGYTTGPANELTSDGTWNYTYDKNGNLIGKANPVTSETWSYGYDNKNRLVSVQQTIGGVVQMRATYVYDALGQRIEKDVWTQGSGSAVITRFAYDRGEIWADLDASNALQTRYVRGDRVLELLARIVSGSVAWFLTDRMKSVRNVADNTGAVTDAITYDGYGNVTSETSQENVGAYKYDGYRYDSETGLYRPDRSTGRYYNPMTGLWVSVDPLAFTADDSNLYRYVANNPVNATDPLGLERTLSCKTRINEADIVANRKCGSVAWPIRWILSEKTKKGGVIVQHVKVTLNITDCECPPKAVNSDCWGGKATEFWEAWLVDKGTKGGKNDMTDSWSCLPQTGETKSPGMTIEGEAIFLKI